MTVFNGSGVALVTPFNADGGIDFGAYAQLLDFQLENGTDAIIACGTTGEASTMTDAEQVQTVAFAVERVAGRVPVIAGAGSNDTRHGVALSRELEQAGADALLHVTPYYNKTSQAGLLEHFRLNAQAVQIPVILYNVPGRTGVNLAPDTAAQLAAELPNVVGIKDATGSLATTIDLRVACGPNFAVYSGNDDINLPILASGGVGVISVLANLVPGAVQELCAACARGDYQTALAIQVRYQRLVHALFMEPNPIPVKAAMELMGLPAGGYRAPLTRPSDATMAVLRTELGALDLLGAA